MNIKNLENNARKYVSSLGNFHVLEYQSDASVAPENARNEYFMSKMGVRRRQIVIELNGKESAIIQAGSMQWMAGHVKATTGIKGVGDLVGKMVKGAITKETAVKPEYVGNGILVLEPTYKYLILVDVGSWGEKGMTIEDGIFYACSGTVKNKLTAAEIEEAEGIIVAADKNVPVERFAGKPVIFVKVADGINKPKELIEEILSGNVPAYAGKGGSEATSDVADAEESLGRQIYKHLMNGVSHMLPFVIGGGILIAIAFLIDGFSVDLNSLPADQRANFGTITQGAALFKGIGGTAFGFMLPILAGFIAMSIADRPGLAVGFVGGSIAANGTSGFLGALVAGFVAGYIVNLLKKIFSKLPESLDGVKPVLLYPLLGIFLIGVIMQFVVEPPIGALNTAINNGLNGLNGASAVVLGVLLGGMMAIDMGGPVNKAAYVFGTASIAAGNYNIMAAVMIGGMVPPIAIALATIFFKNKFTAEERKAGPTNFIMGLSFITEGAIPFAASDPLHVLPACAVGSAVAGGLSMAFGCTLMAPHGGIFVVPTIGNPLMYLVALVIGAFIACGLLGLLKKKVSE